MTPHEQHIYDTLRMSQVCIMHLMSLLSIATDGTIDASLKVPADTLTRIIEEMRVLERINSYEQQSLNMITDLFNKNI